MTRIINFKGKSVSGEWLFGVLFQDRHVSYIIHVLEDENIAYLVRDETICQNTGILDVKKKDIYEYDLVRYIDPHTGESVVGIIVWQNHSEYGVGYGIKPDLNSPDCFTIPLLVTMKLEVIGNYFDEN